MENVPRGTIAQYSDNPKELAERLEIYADELLRWNPTINLISPKSSSELWSRHIIDSLQLNPIVPHGTISALDIGSGGGLPALVLAAAKPEMHWTLVESDQRKSIFLSSTARKMGLGVTVEPIRIENLAPQRFDLITARALAELDQLFEWSVPYSADGTVFLFPKGKTWQNELTQAQKNWQMQYQDFPSQTDSEARILRFHSVKKVELL